MSKEQGLFLELHPLTILQIMPRIDVDTIYKIGTFEFKKAYSVKTHEEAIGLQIGMQTIGMIKPNSIDSHLKVNYRLMHIGLAQVAIKPLLKTGVNAPIYLALRDKRLRHYKSSLLAVCLLYTSPSPRD